MYKYTRRQIVEIARIRLPLRQFLIVKKMLLAKNLNSGGVKSGKNQDNECTVGPYCKCEDCRNYEGDLPIDRV